MFEHQRQEGERLVLQIEFKSTSGPSRPIDFTLARQIPRICASRPLQARAARLTPCP